MNHSVVLKASAIVNLVFGIPLLVAPNLLMGLYGAPELSGPGIYNSMLLGAVLIAFAVLNWGASQHSEAQAQIVVLSQAVGNTLGFIVALFRQLADATVPATAWLNVALFLVFAVLMTMLWIQGVEHTRTPHAHA